MTERTEPRGRRDAARVDSPARDSDTPDQAALGPVTPDSVLDDESLEPTAPVPSAASRPRTRRRVTTPPPAGSDPTPAPEPARSSGTENDDRLKADKPPHWG